MLSGISTVWVLGRGRLGSAVVARLVQRGVRVVPEGELQLLCVPDSAIEEVARSIPGGPWVAHMSGATPIDALAPHVDRFSVHPLQTFVEGRGPEQFDGVWAAVCGETDEARSMGRRLAEALGVRPFELDEANRSLYHAGAAVASNYLVTLERAASRLVAGAGAPPEALYPLIRQTVENGFELTGPIARGDRTTVERHRAAIKAHAPELEAMYDALATLTEALTQPRED
jgi:predicted short-subunit dehydrogenase-like oxidoreductase (DUF2520 family)